MKLTWTKDEDGDWLATVGDLMIRVDREVYMDDVTGSCWEVCGFFAQEALSGQRRKTQYKTSASAKRAAERALAKFLKALMGSE